MHANASKLEIFKAMQAARALDCLPIFVVYERPSDYPTGHIARMFLSGRVEMPTTVTVTGDLEDIQEKLMEVGLRKTERSDDDDPKIVEVWL